VVILTNIQYLHQTTKLFTSKSHQSIMPTVQKVTVSTKQELFHLVLNTLLHKFQIDQVNKKTRKKDNLINYGRWLVFIRCGALHQAINLTSRSWRTGIRVHRTCHSKTVTSLSFWRKSSANLTALKCCKTNSTVLLRHNNTVLSGSNGTIP